MLKKMTSAIFAFSFVWMSLAFAQGEPIGSLFKGKQPIKVYIKEVLNESGQDQVTPELFKKTLQESLLNRKLLKFEITDNPAESDIQVAVLIKKYRYAERGTVKPIPGISMIFDAAAAMTENYAEMSAEYTVTDTESNNVLWHSTVNENLKKVMTPEESVPLICNKIARTFVWKCFGRKQDLE